MKQTILNIALLFLLVLAVKSHNLNSQQSNSTEYKTFLVKTQLTKQELETLLQEGETKLVNLKKNKTKKHVNETTFVKEVVNSTNATIDPLQKKIEQEIKEDALHPLPEFHVKQNEVQTLVAKPNTRFIDSLYEKRFGRFYGFLTLFLFIFVLMYNKELIFNEKGSNGKKRYIYSSEYENEREYMLVKNN